MALRFFVGLCLFLTVNTAQARSGIQVPASLLIQAKHSSIEVRAQQQNIKNNTKLLVAITPNTGWHTYWKNPGDAGLPPVFEVLNEGVTITNIEYAPPSRIPEPPLLTYGYKKPAQFLLTLNVTKKLEKSLALKAFWLICNNICLPEEQFISLDALLNDYRPPYTDANPLSPKILVEQTVFQVDNDVVTLQFPTDIIKNANDLYFYPANIGRFQHLPQQQVVQQENTIQLLLLRNDTQKIDGPLTGVLQQGENYYRVQATKTTVPFKRFNNQPNADSSVNTTIIQAIFFAFLGGIILNVMPCVFPVLALKVSSVMNGQRHIKEALLYTAGIVVSFLVLASILIVFRGTIGWGFQLQQPVFVLFMMLLFVAIALNLFGVFQLPALRSRRLEQQTLKQGNLSHFFTGVLAVLVATPCTVPFMGAAIGYAFTQPIYSTMLVFISLGLGLALPYLLIALAPKNWLQWWPKPGDWLETFKQFLAFPMLATAVWLCWVLATQTGPTGVVWALTACLLLAFLCWAVSRTRGGWRILKGLAVLGLVYCVLHVRPVNTVIDIEEFSQEKLATVLQQDAAGIFTGDRPVFVNVTASWCITCQVNEQLVLSRPKTQQLLQDNNVLYIKADWTFRDKGITRYLKQFGRAGVPTYVLYVPGEKPKTLPELLKYRTLKQALQ